MRDLWPCTSDSNLQYFFHRFFLQFKAKVNPLLDRGFSHDPETSDCRRRANRLSFYGAHCRYWRCFRFLMFFFKFCHTIRFNFRAHSRSKRRETGRNFIFVYKRVAANVYAESQAAWEKVKSLILFFFYN